MRSLSLINELLLFYGFRTSFFPFVLLLFKKVFHNMYILIISVKEFSCILFLVQTNNFYDLICTLHGSGVRVRCFRSLVRRRTHCFVSYHALTGIAFRLRLQFLEQDIVGTLVQKNK